MKFAVQSDSFPIHNGLKKGKTFERTFERKRGEVMEKQGKWDNEKFHN
jgi:hypothetical protein